VFKNRLIAKGAWNISEDVDNIRKEMTTHIWKVFGVSRENKREPKNTWLWNKNVQKTINEKKERYKCLHHHKSDENIQKYKEVRRNTKKIMSETRVQTYAKLY
jgi:hypothetical protein